MATGDYLLFLNSGDYLHNETTLQALRPEDWFGDIVYGDILVLDGRRRIRTIIPEVITADYLYDHTIWHPASFIKKSFFLQHGPYREDFKICADYYFFLKAVLEVDALMEHKAIVISEFNTDGVGSSPKFAEINKRERRISQADFYSPQLLAMVSEVHRLRNRMNSIKFALFAIPRYIVRKLREFFADS